MTRYPRNRMTMVTLLGRSWPDILQLNGFARA